MTRRSFPSDALGAATTHEALASRTIRAILVSDDQQPDMLTRDNSSEHGSAAPLKNIVSAVPREPASGAAPELCSEAIYFAQLLTQARIALYLARKAGQQSSPPAAAGQLSAPGLSADLLDQPAGVVVSAPAGAVGDGGGRSVVIDPTVQHKSQNGRGSHEALRS